MTPKSIKSEKEMAKRDHFAINLGAAIAFQLDDNQVFHPLFLSLIDNSQAIKENMELLPIPMDKLTKVSDVRTTLSDLLGGGDIDLLLEKLIIMRRMQKSNMKTPHDSLIELIFEMRDVAREQIKDLKDPTQYIMAASISLVWLNQVDFI